VLADATTTTTTTSTTTTAVPGALPQGRYNITGFATWGGGGLFLDVADVGGGGQVTVDVTSVGADGTQDPVAQLQGTAIGGTLTLTDPGCGGADCPVSASYGTGATVDGKAVPGDSIYFGAASNGCEAWGSPPALTPSEVAIDNANGIPATPFWSAEECNFVQAAG